jgi:hypothetical protein
VTNEEQENFLKRQKDADLRLVEKPLREMSPDQIAQLAPEKFKRLADAHNDYLELRENAYERLIADSKDPANYPEMVRDASAEWRPMTDKELNHEIYRLTIIANHPDFEMSPKEVMRLFRLEYEEQRRQRDRDPRDADFSALLNHDERAGFALLTDPPERPAEKLVNYDLKLTDEAKARVKNKGRGGLGL